MWQVLRKIALMAVFSSIFVVVSIVWLLEAAPQPTSDPGQKISEDIKQEVDRLYGTGYAYVPSLAADILERAYKTEPEKRQEYITAIKEYPGPKGIWWDEHRRIEVEFLLELLENPEEAGKYFARLEAKKAGKVKVSPEVRQDVEKFFERISKSGDPEEREEAYDELTDESIGRYAAHEYVIALKEHPWPEDKKLRELVEETLEYFVEDIEEDHFAAEVQPRIDKYREEATIAEVKPQMEAFFAGIVSTNAWERKEAVREALTPFISKHGWTDDRPKYCIRFIQTHAWPEGDETQRKIRMVLQVLKDQDEVHSKELIEKQLSSAEEELGIAEEEEGSLKYMVAASRFGERILRDEAANLFIRQVAAQYIVSLYRWAGLSTPYAEEYWGKDEKGRKEVVALREEIESLMRDEDETVSLLMHMGVGVWSYQYGSAGLLPDIKPSIPHFIKGLENAYLYFRLLSQEYLEGFTGQKFDLDPTDPPEIRAKGIAQWKKWWEKNKDKLHPDPDPRKHRLVPFAAEVKPRIHKYDEKHTIAKIKPQMEAFFAGIVSPNARERKEAVREALTPFDSKDEWAIIDDRPRYCIRAIQTHIWPEGDETQRKIRMVLEVLEDQDEFLSKEKWGQLSPTAEELGIAEEVAKEEEVSLEHQLALLRFWEKILRDKAANPIARQMVAQSTAYAHLWWGVASPYAEERWGGDEKARKGIAALREETESLLKDKDKTVSLLMHMGMATWSPEYVVAGVVPDIKDSLPYFIQGLENDYLYFRLLSQEYLEEFTGQKFDLDPSEPPELRGPAIKQWQKWWEENKDKFHYDRMKDQLAQ